MEALLAGLPVGDWGNRGKLNLFEYTLMTLMSNGKVVVTIAPN